MCLVIPISTLTEYAYTSSSLLRQQKIDENAEEHGCEIDQRFEASISAIYSSSVYVQRYLVCVCYFSEAAHQ